ncbi:hypothetical protein CC86DRAFT_317329 [Ophiobolus disseminans]|uniref:CENP-Q, a CENPA-CAD centromere complex subunit-domain-containing protein n=1 Tax=Ophiobolus disseminans TaxID=1469910 RepID=A0A6A7AB98_9PLEO|nr:hypothetical protein CC86DRAFT_317329 [Ophiobolus disseminans]
MAPKRAGADGEKKRRGRPPGSRKSDATTKPARKPAPAKKKTRQAEDEDEDELSGFVAEDAPATKRRKRKTHTEPDELANEEPRPRKKFVQLEARTKRIPQEQIDTWPQVTPQVLEQIVAVIRDAKKDIANTQRDERRVIAAHNTLNPLVRKLSRQLAASRIPPQAKDTHFNIDKLTERNAQVSRDVTTARHSKQLLGEQVKVAERLLHTDEARLEGLKRDAKSWRKEWTHREKHGRTHPLLKGSDDATMYGDRPDDIGLRRSAPVDATLLDTPDAELAPILEQLHRSLENMQGNHAHVEGIDEAMRDAQAAVDDVLFRHASAQQYAIL